MKPQTGTVRDKFLVALADLETHKIQSLICAIAEHGSASPALNGLRVALVGELTRRRGTVPGFTPKFELPGIIGEREALLAAHQLATMAESVRDQKSAALFVATAALLQQEAATCRAVSDAPPPSQSVN